MTTKKIMKEPSIISTPTARYGIQMLVFSTLSNRLVKKSTKLIGLVEFASIDSSVPLTRLAFVLFEASCESSRNGENRNREKVAPSG